MRPRRALRIARGNADAPAILLTVPRRSTLAALLLCSVAALVLASRASAQYPPGPPTTTIVGPTTTLAVEGSTTTRPEIAGTSVLATVPTTTLAPIPTSSVLGGPSTVGPGPTTPGPSTTKAAPVVSAVPSTVAPSTRGNAGVPSSLALAEPTKASSEATCRPVRIDANQFLPNSDVIVRVAGKVIGLRADDDGNVVATVPGVCSVRDGTPASVAGVDKNRRPRSKTVKVNGDLIKVRLNESALTGSAAAVPLTAIAVTAIAGGSLMLLTARRRRNDDPRPPRLEYQGPPSR